MTTQTATIQLRIDRKTKAQSQAIFKKLGMDISTGVKLFLSQVVRTKGIPFKALTVNGFTPEYEASVLKEIKAMKAGREKTFKTFAELIADLNS